MKMIAMKQGHGDETRPAFLPRGAASEGYSPHDYCPYRFSARTITFNSSF
jgi:hypothetical protein